MLYPDERPFADGDVDYWVVGGEASFLPVALKAEAHPLEILDAVAGFFFIDLTGDDF